MSSESFSKAFLLTSKKDVPYPPHRFIDMEDGTVGDNHTGFIWMKDVSWIDTNVLLGVSEFITGTIGQGFKQGDYELSDGGPVPEIGDFPPRRKGRH
jgi:hypothetical protein